MVAAYLLKIGEDLWVAARFVLQPCIAIVTCLAPRIPALRGPLSSDRVDSPSACTRTSCMALATMWGVFEMSCSDKGILEMKKAVLFHVYRCSGQVRPLPYSPYSISAAALQDVPYTSYSDVPWKSAPFAARRSNAACRQVHQIS